MTEQPVTADGGAMPTVLDAARRLAAATNNASPTPPVRDLLAAGDIRIAYAVQQKLIAERLAHGAKAVGRKIGLTNPKVQAQLGVDQPDFGVLLDDMAVPDGGIVGGGRLLQPRIEAEVAFVLGADLDRTGPITAADVAKAIAHAHAALEIVDSRIAGWDISIIDTVADNASCGLFVLGGDETPLDAFVPAEVEMVLHRDQTIVSSGTGADCLGDPLAAVAWLAETVRDHGQPLRAGETILSGALGPMVDVELGATYSADVVGVGRVSVSFAPKPGKSTEPTPHRKDDS